MSVDALMVIYMYIWYVMVQNVYVWFPLWGNMIQFSRGNYFSYGGWMDVTINSTREKFDQNYWHCIYSCQQLPIPAQRCSSRFEIPGRFWMGSFVSVVGHFMNVRLSRACWARELGWAQLSATLGLPSIYRPSKCVLDGPDLRGVKISKTPFGTPQMWTVQNTFGRPRSGRQALPSLKERKVPEFCSPIHWLVVEVWMGPTRSLGIEVYWPSNFREYHREVDGQSGLRSAFFWKWKMAYHRELDGRSGLWTVFFFGKKPRVWAFCLWHGNWSSDIALIHSVRICTLVFLPLSASRFLDLQISGAWV